ncbi:MAG TPA: hypothetical protein VGC77_14200 [Rhodopseudomonas sp.]|uniref:hypothetical protein n=1 Tax=Rhodopseudomonas sp. TaxID=1078 RepID=UPI002ED8DDAF
MATTQEAVERLTFEYKVVGADQAIRAYSQTRTEQDATAQSSDRLTVKTSGYDAALQRQIKTLEQINATQRAMADIQKRTAAALDDQTRAANDNNASWASYGIEVAKVITHMRQVAEIAYAVSPAFRSAVNSMATPALRAAVPAVEAAAQGIVAATNISGTALVSLGIKAASSTTALTPFSTALKSSGAALEAFSPSIAGMAASVGAAALRFVPVIGQLLLLYDAVKLVGEAWRLGGEELEKWIDIAKKAAAVDLSTDYFQRISKAATDAKLPIEDLNAALAKLAQVTANYALLVQQAKDGAVALEQATKINAAKDAYNALSDSIKLSTADTQLQVKFHGDAAGLKEAQVNAQLYAAALKTGLSPEEAAAAVKASGLGAAAGAAAGQLAVLNKTTTGQINAYDQLIQRAKDRNAELALEATAAGQTAGAVQALKLQHDAERAAKKAGVSVNQEELDQLKQEVVLREQEKRLAEVKSQADFTGQTMFMSDADKSAAAAMRDIYGPQWQSHMDDALAKQLKMNSQLSEAKDAAQQFATSFFQGLMQGKSGMDALVGAADQLASKLADKGMQDLFSGNFIQGGVELGASALISVFTGDQKAKKQLEEAKRVWKEAAPEFERFLDSMSGGVQGELSSRIESARQQMLDLNSKAAEAKDYASANKVAVSYLLYAFENARTFISTFSATAEAFSDGLGENSPTLKAIDSVKTAQTKVKSFIDDAKTAYNALNATSADLGVLSGGENSQAYKDAVAKATEASRQYMVSLLQTAPALSQVQSRLLEINGTALALQGALVDLGMSSDQAAAAIASGVTKAIDDLKNSFGAGLTSRLNTANGKGYPQRRGALEQGAARQRRQALRRSGLCRLRRRGAE